MDSKSTSKPFPGFDRIFAVETPGNSQAFRGTINLERHEAFALTRGEIQPPRVLSITWAMGRAKPVEVIRTTLVAPMIVSDSVVQLLRLHGFTGWSLYDVNVQDKESQRIPGYSGLSFTGRCGPIDYSQSVKVPRIRPAGIFPVHMGMLFDPVSWDGSDCFMPSEKGAWMFVVQEVKQAIEKARIRNIEFTRLDQMEINWL